MTDAEPEPSGVPSDPHAAADDAGGDVEGSGVESIADLIDEATRTAAEQAAREASGEEPQDRSAEVWGDDDHDDVDAVWAAAEDTSDAHGVWGAPEAEDDVWDDPDPQATPPPAAQPTNPTPATRQRPQASGATAPTGRPSAMEGMDDLPADVDEPDTFVFSVGDDDEDEPGDAGEVGDVGDAGDAEEPATFRFDAGPDTTAPVPVPDHVAGDTEYEPKAFSFAVDEDEPSESSVRPADVAEDPSQDEPVEAWTVPSDGAADGDEEPDDDLWTSDVATEARQDDGTEAPLAESATPRDDAGWHDLDAEDEPGWSVPDLPLRRREADEDEPAGFTASITDTDASDDDAPWTSGPAPAAEDDDAPWTSGPAPDGEDDDAPWTSGPAPDGEDDEDDTGAVDLPADVVTAEVHDALGDLLGNHDDEGTTPAPAADAIPAQRDPLDELDDLDLDQFDDLGAATDAPPEQTTAGATHDEHDSGEHDSGEHDGGEHDEASDDDEALDAPTAARQVMEPGSVTFSSSGSKKRGLFG